MPGGEHDVVITSVQMKEKRRKQREKSKKRKEEEKETKENDKEELKRKHENYLGGGGSHIHLFS